MLLNGKYEGLMVFIILLSFHLVFFFRKGNFPDRFSFLIFLTFIASHDSPDREIYRTVFLH